MSHIPSTQAPAVKYLPNPTRSEEDNKVLNSTNAGGVVINGWTFEGAKFPISAASRIEE